MGRGWKETIDKGGGKITGTRQNRRPGTKKPEASQVLLAQGTFPKGAEMIGGQVQPARVDPAGKEPGDQSLHAQSPSALSSARVSP